ncbi:MAG: hypothetical protein AAFR67_11475 [Chloroflexota bacterium]
MRRIFSGLVGMLLLATIVVLNAPMQPHTSEYQPVPTTTVPHITIDMMTSDPTVTSSPTSSNPQATQTSIYEATQESITYIEQMNAYETAQEIITHAEQTNATQIELWYLGLTSIPPECVI